MRCMFSFHTDYDSISQLIYDFKDKGSSIGFITSDPDKLESEMKQKLINIGVKLPSRM